MADTAFAGHPDHVIETVEELLAHSLTLEEEAAEHYEDVGENLTLHNNPEVGELFMKLAGYARIHAAEMKELAKGRTLPVIKPWDYKWPDSASPESIPPDELHYLMNCHQALTVARRVESDAQQFYASVAAATSNEEVRKLAAEFADEEVEHVELLDDWIKHYPPAEEGWDEDPDPAHVPE